MDLRDNFPYIKIYIIVVPRLAMWGCCPSTSGGARYKKNVERERYKVSDDESFFYCSIHLRSDMVNLFLSIQG